MLAIVALMLTATAISHAETVLTRHVRQATKDGSARLLGPVPASQAMRLVLSLPLRNEDQLDRFLADVYNPNSPAYRHFLTVDQFTAQFGPTEDDYNAVIDFAQTHGLTVAGVSRNRLNVEVVGTVAAINSALHVKMNLYQHPTEGRSFYAPDREPTVDLPFQLWHVSGLDNFSIPQPAGLNKRTGTQPNATTGSGPSASFLGSDMRAAYYGGTALTGAGQSVGLLEFYGSDLADLNTYFTNAHQTNNVPVTLLSTDGTSTSCLYSSGCDDTEQTLDMTQALGMAPGMAELIMYVGSTDASIFNAMATTPSSKTGKLNAQLACSWAWKPADPNTDDPYFKEFAAQGQNLFVAAGDSGKWPTASSPYYYPADDAYITSVGGTDLQTSSAAGPWSSESAWSSGGGGISPDKIAIPSWQVSTASSCASCSKTYRNAPDVAANANYTFYVCADQTSCTANLYGGTSFAAPMWAGYLALANQQAVANGSTPVGFINPTLYSIGGGSSFDADFHDITSGSNGYSATTGYDLATGWGSPNGAGLIDALAGTTATAGFSLSASPTSLTILQGGTGSSTITSTVTGGFGSAVSLTASGAASGVTVGFSRSSITGTGSSTMNVTVGSSVAAGTYTITVTGTGGGQTQTTTVTLTVTSTSASFTMSASPSSITVARGSSGSVTISTSATGGFNSTISLSASGAKKGVSLSLTPTSIVGSGNSTLTIKANRNAATGTYTITVTGSGGGVTQTAFVSLTVK